MPGPTRTRNSGIRKHQQRRDRDGDLVMGAAPRVTPARPSPRNSTNGSSHKSSSTPTPGFTELKVTGWSDDKEMSKLLNFLERHSARRSPTASKSSVPPKMIKRHKVSEDTLTIWVRPEDVVAFGKINGFTFNSAHGTQKLNIAGPGIRSKSPNAATAMDTTSDADRPGKSNDTVDLLKTFLERRYSPSEKLLNLSTIADDEEVAKSGMWNSVSTQEKFFPALMVVCNTILKTPEEKAEAVHSVTLTSNNLPNVQIVYKLAETLPQIKNLDLSGNKFSSPRDLKAWKGRFKSLEHLIVDIAEPGFEDELVSWFPKLRILNGQQVRADPVPATPAPTAATSTEPAPLLPEQEAMVEYVQKETNLKREFAVQCLQAANWNIEAAAQLFLSTKDTLSAESFN